MWLYNGAGKEALRMVVNGGVAPAQIGHTKPLGPCGANLHSKDSFYNGKRLRMGHYAVILQLRFRLNLRVYQLASKWLAMSV
jgi:hypothetical protein